MSSDLNVDPGGDIDPNADEEPTGSLEADDLAELFMMTDALRITGDLPTAGDGGLQINVEDTMYVVKDFELGTRVALRHDSLWDVTGVYVGVSGDSFYYDVPVVEGESQDSVSVIYIVVGDPESEADYPLDIPIELYPHGPDGGPIDGFKRVITVEDPDDPDTCSLLHDDYVWEWMYTTTFNYQGDIFQITAPWFSATYREEGSGGYYYSACCVSGVHVPYGEPTGVDGPCDERNPHFRKIWVNTGIYLKGYDYLFLFTGGRFIHYASSFISNSIPERSTCRCAAFYSLDVTESTHTGTHDYVPGADDLYLTTTASDPGFGPSAPFGKIIHTCHMLIFTVGAEEKSYIVYRRTDGSDDDPRPDPMDYLDP